jgi:hypothetical protein
LASNAGAGERLVGHPHFPAQHLPKFQLLLSRPQTPGRPRARKLSPRMRRSPNSERMPRNPVPPSARPTCGG